MVCTNLNGIADKVNALIIYQNKQTTELCENEFIDEFYCHSCCICAHYLCFHPFGGVIGSYQNVFVFNIPTHVFDWVNKI